MLILSVIRQKSTLVRYSLLVLTFAVAAPAAPPHLTVTAAQWLVIPHESTLHLTSPSEVRTTCWASHGYSGNPTFTCSGYVYPATDVPITFSTADVYDELITGGLIYTTHCIAFRQNSSCVQLNPGDRFLVELKKPDWIHVTLIRDGQERKSWRRICFERSASTGLAIPVPHSSTQKLLTMGGSNAVIGVRAPIFQMMGMSVDPLIHPLSPGVPTSADDLLPASAHK